jgi:hypothetical protein
MISWVISVIFSISLSYHPVHVSVTNIEYNKSTENFDIAIKIYQDDFERSIKNYYGVDLNLGKADQLSGYKEFINKYISKNFRIIVNDKDKTDRKLVFKEFKINELAVWLYYEYKKVDKVKSITIKNTFLNDLYFDQSNLLIFTHQDFQKAIKFTNSFQTETWQVK